jgi:uncharacterized protein (TIGR02466 family)
MLAVHDPRLIDLDVLNHGICAAYAFTWNHASAHKQGLLEAIHERKRQSRGITRTNVGGWHSETDLPRWRHPSTAALMKFIVDCADRAVAATNGVEPDWRRQPWIAHAWANVNPPGGAANSLHDHVSLNWHWSGCYYVQCDIDEDADGDLGRLVFENRWHGLRLKEREPHARECFHYAPKEGEVVFFPSWQHHRVEPHRQAGDRVSIAFNLFSPELERSRYWTHRPGSVARKAPAIYDLFNRLRGHRAPTADGVPPGYPIG